MAALLVVILSAAFGTPLTCAGWEGSPQSRLKCCKRAHHTSCHDQSAADDCCAGHEQGRIATMTAATALANIQAMTVLTPTFETAVLATPTAVIFSSARIRQLHGPPDLLVPLRI